MEWLALIAQLILLGVFLLWEGYFKEKGKNLATKEDIKDITDKVESVKASYNESLERHKIELQKEFESHKYISILCQNIDRELINLIVKALSIHHEQKMDDVNDRELIASAYGISNFLSIYRERYGNNTILHDLGDIADKIKILSEIDGDENLPFINKNRYLVCLNNAAGMFLPKIK
jgi:hypothetical protein